MFIFLLIRRKKKEKFTMLDLAWLDFLGKMHKVAKHNAHLP